MNWLAYSFSAFRSRRFLWVRLLLLAACVLLLGWGGLVGARHLSARHHFRIAQLALDRDDFDLAQQHLEICLQIRDDEPDFQLLAAKTARRRDDYDRADAYLTAYERLQGLGRATHFERQLLIAQQGDPDSVRQQLETAIRNRPDQAVTVLEALGKGYLNSFITTDALKCFNALLKIRPDHAMGLLWRGKTYESLDRFDKALPDYQRAVEISGSLDEARLCLGLALRRAGRSWEAIPHFECLRQRKPKSPEVLLGLALCRGDLHDLQEARQCLNALLAEHRDHGGALLELGRLEYHAGQTAAAEKLLRRAAALSPNDEDTHRALLLCLKTQGKDAEARNCLAQLEAIEAKLRQLDNLIRKAKDGGPDAPLRWEIAEYLRRLGREQDAVSYYFAALGDDANYRPAHAALADYYQRIGQVYRAGLHRQKANH
jgi:tetratricopeptide (TPR) repeat protein